MKNYVFDGLKNKVTGDIEWPVITFPVYYYKTEESRNEAFEEAQNSGETMGWYADSEEAEQLDITEDLIYKLFCTKADLDGIITDAIYKQVEGMNYLDGYYMDWYAADVEAWEYGLDMGSIWDVVKEYEPIYAEVDVPEPTPLDNFRTALASIAA